MLSRLKRVSRLFSISGCFLPFRCNNFTPSQLLNLYVFLCSSSFFKYILSTINYLPNRFPNPVSFLASSFLSYYWDDHFYNREIAGCYSTLEDSKWLVFFMIFLRIPSSFSEMPFWVLFRYVLRSFTLFFLKTFIFLLILLRFQDSLSEEFFIDEQWESCLVRLDCFPLNLPLSKCRGPEYGAAKWWIINTFWCCEDIMEG